MGYYLYEFDTTGQTVDTMYSVLWEGKDPSGQEFQIQETFRLITTYTEGEAPSAEGTTYCILADVLEELSDIDLSSLTDVNDQINTLIPRKESKIDRKTLRTFKTKTMRQYLNGNGTAVTVLPHIPVRAVSQCILRVIPSTTWHTFANIAMINTVGDDGIQVTTPATDEEVQAADLLVDANTGQMTIPARVAYADTLAWPFWNYMWLKGVGNILVNWEWGYDTDRESDSFNLPPLVTDICAKMVAVDILKRLGVLKSGGVMGVSVDGYSKSWGNMPYYAQIQLWMAEIEDGLNHYRRIGISV